MRFTILALMTVSLAVPTNVYAQDDKIARASHAIKEFCGVEGNRLTQTEAEGHVQGGLSLTKLPELNAGASVNYTDREAKGIAGAVYKELNENAMRLSQTQIECMKPSIGRILDAILMETQKPEPVQPTPRFNISGSIDTGSGIAHISQDGSKIGWFFDTPAVSHSMQGHYTNATEFTGTQTRILNHNGCIALMTIKGTVAADRSFEIDSRLADDSPSSCDLPRDYHEHVSQSGYSPI